MIDTELKHCPFCGGKADMVESEACLNGSAYADVFQVCCTDCVIEGGEFEFPVEAAKQWNTRESGWISVDDALPEFDTVVLVAFDISTGKNYTTCKYVNLKYCQHHDERIPVWYVHVSGGHELKTVTHWMPLPQPPSSK